jgi:hypothetical protein
LPLSRTYTNRKVASLTLAVVVSRYKIELASRRNDSTILVSLGNMATQHGLMSLLQHQLPFVLVFASISIYVLGYLVIRLFKPEEGVESVPVPAKLDQAEKGNVVREEKLTEKDQFELEKRAFLSKVRRQLSFVIQFSRRSLG